MNPSPQIRWTHRTWQLLWRASFHGAGVAVSAAALGVACSDAQLMGALFEARGVLLSENMPALVLHLGVSLAAWGGLVWGHAMLRAPRLLRRVRLAGGTAIVEMLIITLPFLLMTSGLAQLSVNNITGVAAHLAAYQAGRAYWIWEKEAHPENARPAGLQVSPGDVNELVTLAAASAMAPVAPSTHILNLSSTPDGLASLRAVMYAHYANTTVAAKGSSQRAAAQSAATGGTQVTRQGDTLSFDKAFDADSFPSRAARKLSFAYAATTVEAQVTAGMATTTVTYKHYQAFPWFGWLFGDDTIPVAGRQGYYATYKRTYSVPAQVKVR